MAFTIFLQAGLPGVTEPVITRAGDVLTIDGADYDLSDVQEGDEATWPDSPFLGPITRVGGTLNGAILYHFDPANAAAHQPENPTLHSWTSGAMPDPVTR